MTDALKPIEIRPNGADKETPPQRKRMGRDEREQMIVNGAVSFFAEHGFEGKTRDLANELGITQPLLYRYFPSKEALIERVYDAVYVKRWQPRWETLITDRGQPLEARLCQFYKEYARAVYDYVWVRIFMYAGLKGVDFNTRYLSVVRGKVLEPICEEVRAHFGLADPSAQAINDYEIELAWGLHGSFFYRAIRCFVYNMPIPEDVDAMIEQDVKVFLTASETSFPAALKV